MKYKSSRILPIIATIICFSVVSSATAESSLPDSGPMRAESFLDFNPARAGFPAQLDGVVKPLTAALNMIRRDGSTSAGAEARQPLSRDGKAALLQAIERADALEETLPRGLSDELHFLEGFAFELLGEPQKAVAAYDQSLRIRSLNPLVSFRKAMALKQANQCPKALQQLQEVQWMSDKLAHEVLFAQAQCQLALGRADLAVSLLEQARKKAPGYAPAVKLLLDTRMKVFDASPRAVDNTVAAKMTEDLSEMSAARPGDSQTSLMLAKLLVKKSDPLVALEDLKRGEQIAFQLAEKAQFKDDSIVRLVFDAQIKRGDIPAAGRTVARGLSVTPTSKPLLDAARQLEVYKESGL